MRQRRRGDCERVLRAPPLAWSCIARPLAADGVRKCTDRWRQGGGGGGGEHGRGERAAVGRAFGAAARHRSRALVTASWYPSCKTRKQRLLTIANIEAPRWIALKRTKELEWEARQTEHDLLLNNKEPSFWGGTLIWNAYIGPKGVRNWIRNLWCVQRMGLRSSKASVFILGISLSGAPVHDFAKAFNPRLLSC